MYWWQSNPQWKYVKIEIAFFVVFFYFFPAFSVFEYNFIELHKAIIPEKDLVSTLFYGTSDILTSFVFYKLIQGFLFTRRFASFIAVIIIYLLLFHFYKRGLYYSVGHSSLLPESLSKESLKWYNANSRINFSIVYMCMEFLCLAALAYFIRSSKQEEQMHLLKEQQLSSELNYLKAQLHPHFFFNTINNIYSLALKQSADTAPMVAKLGDMMRYVLYEADQKKVSLAREIEFLANYVSVEKIRHPDNQTIQFDVQGITNDVYMEPLLLLPFIENAFKHGLQEETAAGFVTIIICRAEQELTLQVSNSKPPKTEVAAAKGIGLQNVIKRLDILYPGNYQLEINDEATIHHALLTLQIA
ncbi:sensor histidine kinase [Mucilaginibacter polytrichastri]|uniref:Signal transduction histidine kinase internal region domain-containing protein n=1 Tax=Mucilaginibacter polytrichastri TaxID=1302689 RepID=A0A1Q6A5H8_9SPHI|nr:histidine kinase [Mucilaginibacter polytrichastri]OKS89264.1 hypothetical protein RG47T_4748 [Mucilaginibacter polytrichastri]SFS75397.1 Histidine kinase [Mucilaginibacter polytrichastri]